MKERESFEKMKQRGYDEAVDRILYTKYEARVGKEAAKKRWSRLDKRIIGKEYEIKGKRIRTGSAFFCYKRFNELKSI